MNDEDVRAQDDRWYAACRNEGCGVCGPIRRTEDAAHADAREHAKVCTSAGEKP